MGIASFGREVPFANGGWVVHGIRLIGHASKYSAWYDEHGNLQDAEAIDARNRARRVTSARILYDLRRLGQMSKA